MRLFRLEGEPLYGDPPHVLYIVSITIKQALDEWRAPGNMSCVKIEEICADVVIVDG